MGKEHSEKIKDHLSSMSSAEGKFRNNGMWKLRKKKSKLPKLKTEPSEK